MSWGVRIDTKNTRGHEVIDLSTNPDISYLIS